MSQRFQMTLLKKSKIQFAINKVLQITWLKANVSLLTLNNINYKLIM